MGTGLSRNAHRRGSVTGMGRIAVLLVGKKATPPAYTELAFDCFPKSFVVAAAALPSCEARTFAIQEEGERYCADGSSTSRPFEVLFRSK